MPLTTIQSGMMDSVAQYYGFKNRIINGNMVIAQRGTTSFSNGSGATANFPVDRFTIYGSQASKFTGQQNAASVTPPAGFINYLGCTSSSAYAVLASDYFWIYQRIEGYNIADLGWGTASAHTVTLSFWVRSSLTGTFGGSITNSALNRSYPFTYTISAANTWEQKAITIAGDTTGTWATNNTSGIEIYFNLGTGSTFSGTAGAWAAGQFYAPTGATSVVGTNGATFYVTGVQFEKGVTATSFDYRPYGTELQLCQRYTYALSTPGGGATQYFLSAGGVFSTTTTGFFGFSFPQVMRAVPSLSPAPTAGNYQIYVPNGGAYQTLTGISLNAVTTSNFALLNIAFASGGTAGQGFYLNSTAANSAPIILSAEL